MLEQWIRSLSWRGPRGSCGRWWHAPPGGAAIEDLEERFRKLKLRVEMLRLLIVAEEDEEERVVRIRSVERSPESGAVAPTRGGRIPASLEVFQCDAEKQHPEGFIRRLVAQLTVAQVPQDRWPAILAIQVRGSAEGWAQRVLLDAPSWEEAKELFLRRFLLPQDELRRREELYALRQRDGESVLQYASLLNAIFIYAYISLISRARAQRRHRPHTQRAHTRPHSVPATHKHRHMRTTVPEES